MNMPTRPKHLTDSQYRAVSDLFNECNHDFWAISEATRNAFFDRLYSSHTYSSSPGSGNVDSRYLTVPEIKMVREGDKKFIMVHKAKD